MKQSIMTIIMIIIMIIIIAPGFPPGLFAVPSDDLSGLSAPLLLNRPLEEGEALIWHLFHSGWAVKTRNALLIFDYWEGENPEKPQNPSLNNGFIHPPEIAGVQTYVFISHAHDDHYQPSILEWAKAHPRITYIFGWKADENPAYIYFSDKRETLRTGDLEILNIHHAFDQIPESAFLARTDGLTLFFAGDHGHGKKGPLNPVFKDNVDYLARVSGKVDIMFTPDFGGEKYMIETLNPRVVFPMHDGDNEIQYKKFAEKAARIGLKAIVGVAARRGDCFFYSRGALTPLNE